MNTLQTLYLVSYNLRGLKDGAGLLPDQCNSHNIIVVQELWLRTDELHKLGLISNNFNYHLSLYEACGC